MSIQAALRKITAFAESFYAGADFAHGLEHGRRVVAYAKRIRQEEGGSEFLVEAGAWLHQLHDDLPELERFLSSLPMESTLKEELYEIVRFCRPEVISAEAPLEAKIVFDADALELMGAYGIVRELLVNAVVRQKSWRESAADAREVQDMFADRLMTDTARALSVEERKLSRTFWRQYAVQRSISGA